MNEALVLSEARLDGNIEMKSKTFYPLVSTMAILIRQMKQLLC